MKAAQVAFFMLYRLKIYSSTSELPFNWNTVIGDHNIMLSKEYFDVLESSRPDNMQCYYVGAFKGDELIGGVLFQYLDFIRHKTFQKDEVWCSIRNAFARQFSRNVMILGNNMLTGQNGFYFNPSEISWNQVVTLLNQAVDEMQKKIRKTSLVIYKDYRNDFIKNFKDKNHESYFKFSVQPNMILKLNENWSHFDDYLNDFSTKYRTRAKAAKKKIMGIEKHEMDIETIKTHQSEMNFLYQNVAENAPFNTFFLSENHFQKMKENLNRQFKVFGYFLDQKLIGFYTLIHNNKDIDTYFLGYNKELQKEKQLYLNMLLDMVEFGINHQVSRVIFGRTALEIKSTIGAEPVEMFGLMRHNNQFLNPFMERFFLSVTPKTEWVQRKPFKNV